MDWTGLDWWTGLVDWISGDEKIVKKIVHCSVLEDLVNWTIVHCMLDIETDCELKTSTRWELDCPGYWTGGLDYVLMDWTSGLLYCFQSEFVRVQLYGGLDWWTGLVDWTSGLDWWTGLVDWTSGLDWWTGLVDWTSGLEWWTGLVDKH